MDERASGSIKKQGFVHLRVDLSDGQRIRMGQFTVFDLVDRCFSFSQKRKQLAVQVLTLLAEKPKTFTSLLTETQASKSSLHLTLSALEQSGLVRQDKRGAVFELSDGFVAALMQYAGFWKTWKNRQEGEGIEIAGLCDVDAGSDGQKH